MKIAIIGVGLIGGSLALCFRGQPNTTVVGYSPRESSVRKYIERGVCDSATTVLADAVAGADFIFLCVPVGKLGEYVTELASLPLKNGVIITDVGSTKASVMRAASEALGSSRPDVTFIGGHPMAGSERSGVEAASVYLFENAYYVLTPAADTPADKVEALSALLKSTRANIVHVPAEHHDLVVGAISHLPHVIAVALVNQIRGYDADDSLFSQLAAGGFRDITRIASSDPVVWRDILTNNREVLIHLLSEWKEQTLHWIEVLTDSPSEGTEKFIEQAFSTAGQFRNSLPERRKGVIHSLYECYVDVPDEIGVVGRVATALAHGDINLSNIHIMESREDVPGVLRLSFGSDEDVQRARKLLEGQGFNVHV